MIGFNGFMTMLPALLLGTVVSMALAWVVIRSAVLSALRKHAAEQRADTEG
ncbi:hypothetical protein [Psychromicrobium xiongbiense]|uniref:hypothetical protein n=1 Tax=Psychromicrobium xiongbiense TaxID=3051184 RepID=UPI0025560538|nr:hypothetical protein [Psychromicrobium sp. YIM S02556]